MPDSLKSLHLFEQLFQLAQKGEFRFNHEIAPRRNWLSLKAPLSICNPSLGCHAVKGCIPPLPTRPRLVAQ